MHLNKVAIVLVILLSFDAKADEVFNFETNNQGTNQINNHVVKTTISKTQITRLSFDHDVESINSLKNELEYDIQGKDVFLRTNTRDKVNFFVKTDNGNVYKFIANIADIPAIQIFVKSELQAKEKEASVTTPNLRDNYNTASISKIIDIALNPRPYLGYSYKKLDKSLYKHLFLSKKCLTKRLIAKVYGNGLLAEKIIITNKNSMAQDLNIKEFITGDTLAIYHSGTKIHPGESITVIRVTTNSRSDIWA
jgi:hypothetical protein